MTTLDILFKPIKIGNLNLPNRIWLAPLTRCRAGLEHLPNDLMAKYYAQRASAGLSITEATMVMEGNSSFWQEPGVYSKEQVIGWRKTTDAVHKAGGRIFLQLWHGGRACHPLLNGGKLPVAPSAIAISGDVHTPEGKKPYVVPHELLDSEIPSIIAGFERAAKNAKEAGFDGVEIHGANGYILDQFWRNGSNKRVGLYGGSVENRARLMLEVISTTCKIWDSKQVGLRISPLNSYNSMVDSDPIGIATWLAKKLNEYNLGYLHVMRGDFFQVQKGDVLTPIRANYKGIIVGNMGYSAEEAAQAISEGILDAVAFGSTFLANPDLPNRIRQKAPLTPADPNTFYTSDAKGYTDYPTLNA